MNCEEPTGWLRLLLIKAISQRERTLFNERMRFKTSRVLYKNQGRDRLLWSIQVPLQAPDSLSLGTLITPFKVSHSRVRPRTL